MARDAFRVQPRPGLSGEAPSVTPHCYAGLLMFNPIRGCSGREAAIDLYRLREIKSC